MSGTVAGLPRSCRRLARIVDVLRGSDSRYRPGTHAARTDFSALDGQGVIDRFRVTPPFAAVAINLDDEAGKHRYNAVEATVGRLFDRVRNGIRNSLLYCTEPATGAVVNDALAALNSHGRGNRVDLSRLRSEIDRSWRDIQADADVAAVVHRLEGRPRTVAGQRGERSVRDSAKHTAALLAPVCVVI